MQQEQSEPVKVATEPYSPQFTSDAVDDDPFRTEPYKLQTPKRKE